MCASVSGNASSAEGNCTLTLSTQASSYLFPFILEYSLIAVAGMASRFIALEIRISGEVLQSIKRYLRKAKREALTHSKHDVAQHEEKMLDKSFSGLYTGILVFTLMVIAFALSMSNIASEDPNDNLTGHIIYDSLDVSLSVIGYAACLLAWWKLRRFRYSFLRSNSIDHLLLLISFCGLMLYNLFVCIGNFYYISIDEYDEGVVLSGTASLLNMLQAKIQTCIIIFGMQVYSHRPEQRREKPGRGVITFLIILNLSFWVFRSFGEKNVSMEVMDGFYGVTPWQIIMHFSLPFMLFYRFHSSVCFADIWASAYENEESPVQYVDVDGD